MAADRILHNWCIPIESLRKQAHHLRFDALNIEQGRQFQVILDQKPVYLISVHKRCVDEDVEKPVNQQRIRVAYQIQFITKDIRVMAGKPAMCQDILESTKEPRIYVSEIFRSVAQKTLSFEIGIHERRIAPDGNPPVKWTQSETQIHVDMVYKLLRVILDLHRDDLTAPDCPALLGLHKKRAEPEPGLCESVPAGISHVLVEGRLRPACVMTLVNARRKFKGSEDESQEKDFVDLTKDD